MTTMTDMNKCPACDEYLIDNKCRLCGMEKTFSNTSGNVIFMRKGRVYSAPQDESDAIERMHENYPQTKENGNGEDQ